MTRERIRLGVTTCDAIVVRGQIQIISKVTEAFVEHRPLRGDGDPISLSHMELSELIDQGHYSIQYGYFSSRQVARRAMAGRGLMSRLPVKTQRDAFWKECWCTSILALEGEGKFNRSAARWEEFLPALEQRTTEMLKLGLNKSKAGRSFDSVEARRTPSRTSIMSWLRKWETSKDPMVLVKKSIFNGQRAKRIGSEQEAILQGCLEAYELGLSSTTVITVSQGKCRSRRVECAIALKLGTSPEELCPNKYKPKPPKSKLTRAKSKLARPKSKLAKKRHTQRLALAIVLKYDATPKQ